MAPTTAAKGRRAPKAKLANLIPAGLNANDGRGGYARTLARKTAVKKAFGQLTGKR